MKLLIYLEQLENTLLYRVEDQSEYKRSFDYTSTNGVNIITSDTPRINKNEVYLRGKNRNYDMFTTCKLYEHNREAKENKSKFLFALKEFVKDTFDGCVLASLGDNKYLLVDLNEEE